MHVYTAEALAEGQELTVSYLSVGDLELPVQERLDLIEESFKFTCLCSRCKREGGT
jgi:uncharacterized protein YpmS